MSQIDQMAKFRKIINESFAEGSACNMTAEGTKCPVHGLEECGVYEDDMTEDKKPDFLDFNKNGDTDEPMTDALKDLDDKSMEEDVHITLDGPEADTMISRLLTLAGQDDKVEQATDMAFDAADQALNATDLALDATDISLDAAGNIDQPELDSADSHYVCDDCGNELETCMCTDDTCDTCNSTECNCNQDQMTTYTQGLVDSENLDEDYGHETHSAVGEEVDVNTYMYKGPKLAQRLVKGVMGDNPIAEASMDRFVKLANDYADFLAESDIPNEDGQASPLTAADRADFDQDPFAGEDVRDTGEMSPLSQIKRQDVMK